jgi:hypothetical protein
MVAFSKERLEGRALEHALAGDRRTSIRMYDERSGEWVSVATQVAKTALTQMRRRSKDLVQQLQERGFVCSGGDKAVTVDGSTMSVDLYMQCASRGGWALVEVKWGRKDFKACVRRAKGCIPKLKAAAARGRWLSSRKVVAASIVGALAVSPETWSLELQAAKGRWKDAYDAETPPVAKTARTWSGKSNWEKWRKGAFPGERPAWPSGRSGRRRPG